MSSWLSKARAVFDMGSVVAAALDLVGDIARGKIGTKNKTARELLDMIALVVERVKAGFDGKITADEIKAEIAKMRDDLASNDAAADAAVDEKFPPG